MIFIYGAVAISAIVWLLIIYRYDRLEPEPVKVLAYLLIAGGFLSSFPASYLNVTFAELTGFMTFFVNGTTHTMDPVDVAIFSIFVGFNEEILKALVTVFLVRKLKDFNEPIDGLIYSMTVALGFAAYENIQYTLMGGLDTLLLRSLTSVPIHIGLASIWGIGISKGKFIRGNLKIVKLFPYITAAAVLHSIYDFIQFKSISEDFSFYIAFIFSMGILFFAIKRMKLYLYESPFIGSLKCSNCGHENELKSIKCSSCGDYLTFRFYKICRECGERNSKRIEICGQCNSSI